MTDDNPVTPSLERVLNLSTRCLEGIVRVDAYDFAPCYLWYDRPLFNEFGEVIEQLRGDTIYLFRDSATLVRDLFHELGHVVARRNNLVGHAENGFNGSWEATNSKLIAEVCAQRHWSAYLNLYALSHPGFETNAASELWAELFMLWHLQPDSDEAGLLNECMQSLQGQADCAAIASLNGEPRLSR